MVFYGERVKKARRKNCMSILHLGSFVNVREKKYVKITLKDILIKKNNKKNY